MSTKVRALVRKNKVMLPEPEVKMLTYPEILETLGSPYDGQASRYGRGKDQVDKLWRPEELAVEIHESPQATMLNKFNVEAWEDAAGKFHRAGGNRTQLATGQLYEAHGDKDVEVTIESETPEGRAVKLKHIKNYGVKFPVKFYGKLTPDQVVELETRDNRAVKKASEADFFHKGWMLLKTTNISTQPSKEKMLVRRVGVTDFNDQFPQRLGLSKKTGERYLPCVSVDSATGDITINGRENVQTFFRLFALPDEIAMAFFAGLSGEGPAITKRSLVKLEEAWTADKEAAGKGRLNNSMSKADIEKIFATLKPKVTKDPLTGVETKVQPASSLLANFVAATAKKGKGGKKIVPWSGGEMKKYEEGLFASTTLGTILLQCARREPKYTRESVITALVEAMVAAEHSLGATHPLITKLFAEINSESKEESESEDEENVDPETGEPLPEDDESE